MQIAPQQPQNALRLSSKFLTKMVVIVSALQLPGAVLGGCPARTILRISLTTEPSP